MASARLEAEDFLVIEPCAPIRLDAALLVTGSMG